MYIKVVIAKIKPPKPNYLSERAREVYERDYTTWYLCHKGTGLSEPGRLSQSYVSIRFLVRLPSSERVTDLPWTRVFLSLLNRFFAAQQEQARDHSKSELKYVSSTASVALISSDLGDGHSFTFISIPWEAALWTHAFHGEGWLTLINALRTEASTSHSLVSTTLSARK